jgi:hypothetical protein
MEPLTTFLLYSLRFLVILSAVLLWVVAMSEIKTHARNGSFTTTQLALMAVAVSVVAVGAIAALNSAVPSHGWTDPNPRRAANTTPPDQEECATPSYTFTYSFGLRHPASAPQECPAKPTGNSHLPHVARQGTEMIGG